MHIAIIGGGINGICCAYKLAETGHKVELFERNQLMQATSSASSKLLHGGLRYLENGDFRLVREALCERDGWIIRAPHLAKTMRLILPIYKQGRRGRWLVGSGLFLYDHIAGKSRLPPSKWLTKDEVLNKSPELNQKGLQGGYEFSDGQMDDYHLGLWMAQQAEKLGVKFHQQTNIEKITTKGEVEVATGKYHQYDRLINIAGPWAAKLLEESGIESPYQLDLVRGSHLIISHPCQQAWLLEVPNERRIFFVLPWQGKTLIGTTEVRQKLEEEITCSQQEREYLLNAYQYYWPNHPITIEKTFAGVRPLLYSAQDPGRATREYAIFTKNRLTTVLGGKWTTSMALAHKVCQQIKQG